MILFFDTETTGMIEWGQPSEAACQPWMVQYCGLLMDEKRRVITGLSTLIYPVAWDIPADVTRIHGITTEMCQKYGTALQKVLNWHAAMYRSADLVVGHNLSFDKRIIRIQHAKMGQKEDTPQGKPEYCTMRKGTAICRLPQRPGKRGPYKWPRLEELHRHLFGQAFAGAHDAMSDVTATAKCYFRMADSEKPMAVVGTEAEPAQAGAQVQGAPAAAGSGDGNLGWPTESDIRAQEKAARNNEALPVRNGPEKLPDYDPKPAIEEAAKKQILAAHPCLKRDDTPRNSRGKAEQDLELGAEYECKGPAAAEDPGQGQANPGADIGLGGPAR